MPRQSSRGATPAPVRSLCTAFVYPAAILRACGRHCNRGSPVVQPPHTHRATVWASSWILETEIDEPSERLHILIMSLRDSSPQSFGNRQQKPMLSASHAASENHAVDHSFHNRDMVHEETTTVLFRRNVVQAKILPSVAGSRTPPQS